MPAFRYRRVVPEDVGLDGRLFEGLVVHEMIELGVGVQVLDVVEIQPGILHTVPGLKGLVDVGAGHAGCGPSP